MKKIKLRDVKICDWMSEETTCFKATVTVDGEDICTAKNDGKGGCTDFYPVKINDGYEKINQLNNWCKDNLPKWKSHYFPKKKFDRDLEFVVGELLDEQI
tara:strand:- start:1303 stop:1602 length:300 start_codon:yes stop_codon:yes gene_type:complete